MAWIRKYILHFYLDVITYPWYKLDAYLAKIRPTYLALSGKGGVRSWGDERLLSLLKMAMRYSP